MSKSRIVAVIPARAGSKRIKNKNIKEICGQPLISYSILDAIRVKNIDRVFVSTDSKSIAKIAEKYGAEAPFLRPKKLASDESTDMDWIIHFLDWFKAKERYLPDYLVHLRPTTPLREPTVIADAIIKAVLYKDCTSLRSVEELPESPFKCFKQFNEILIPYMYCDVKDFTNLPNQLFPKAYKPNGYVDVLKVNTILKGSIHGDRILSFLTPRVPEIDTIEDFEYAEYKMKKELEKESELLGKEIPKKGNIGCQT